MANYTEDAYDYVCLSILLSVEVIVNDNNYSGYRCIFKGKLAISDIQVMVM